MPDGPRNVDDFVRLVAEKLGVRPAGSLTVNVSAPRPGRREQMADDEHRRIMEQISLGDATTPPLGAYSPATTHTAPSGDGLPPAAKAAWEEANRRWPHSTKYVDAVTVDSNPLAQMLNPGLAYYDPSSNAIIFSKATAKETDQDLLTQILAHELRHANDARGFATREESRRRSTPLTEDYEDRIGERAAYDSQYAYLGNRLAERQGRK